MHFAAQAGNSALHPSAATIVERERERERDKPVCGTRCLLYVAVACVMPKSMYKHPSENGRTTAVPKYFVLCHPPQFRLSASLFRDDHFPQTRSTSPASPNPDSQSGYELYTEHGAYPFSAMERRKEDTPESRPFTDWSQRHMYLMHDALITLATHQPEPGTQDPPRKPKAI